MNCGLLMATDKSAVNVPGRRTPLILAYHYLTEMRDNGIAEEARQERCGMELRVDLVHLIAIQKKSPKKSDACIMLERSKRAPFPPPHSPS